MEIQGEGEGVGTRTWSTSVHGVNIVLHSVMHCFMLAPDCAQIRSHELEATLLVAVWLLLLAFVSLFVCCCLMSDCCLVALALLMFQLFPLSISLPGFSFLSVASLC